MYRRGSACHPCGVADADVFRFEVGERIGLIGDIHGHSLALEAVLDAGTALGVDRWLVLGDVVAMGPDPGRVLDQLDSADVVATVSGNTDRYVLTGDRPDPTFEQVVADPGLLPRLVEVAAIFAWTKGYLAATCRLDTLLSYASEFRALLPDGTELLAVHGSLVSDEGAGVSPSLSPTEVDVLFPGLSAGLVIAGHTHVRTDLVIEGVRFVNPGSVSNHHCTNHPATFSLLQVNEDCYSVSHHDAPYDTSAAVDAIRRCGIPGADFLIERYFGDGGL